jgi:type I restriction enzyme M protein
MAKNTKAPKEESLEKRLWKTADKLRKNIDAAEYKHVVLGLIFLKYISDSFTALQEKLIAGEGEYAGADPEDKDEYGAENVFFVPAKARWSYIQSQAKMPNIGKQIDDAMDLIEAENATLKGILPKTYGRSNLDPQTLGGLIDTIGTIALGDDKSKSQDVLGRVYEYFLGQFALAEGQKGGQFYTPKSVVKLLVEMLEPYNGRVYDPCCGSGGMFVQSEKFIENHQGRLDDISVYGQESNQTTYRLCRMNLAIRGIDGSNIRWNTEGSFLNDAHRDLKADYIIANPPFNDSDWYGELLQNDARWQFGTPPASNANFAWIQHFIYHLAPTGTAGFVLADSSMNSLSIEESKTRKELVQADLIDCMVTLPSHLFSNTQITACLWFLSRNKNNDKFKKRSNEYLFIDASRMGLMTKRKQRELSEEDILKISQAYHSWRDIGENYTDIPGFCKSVSKDEIQKNDYVLSPNRYVKTLDQEIEIEANFNDFSDSKNLSKTISNLSNTIESAIDDWRQDKPIQVSKFHISSQFAEKIKVLTENYYSSLIKKYFIDFDLNNGATELVESEIGFIPKGWQVKSFAELFEERTLKVKEHGYCPAIFSVTNLGIIPREGKYTKELSKSTENYKVAFKGDMVFGLSRDIPNLDVLVQEEGAFSGAYSIYKPMDKRIGMIVGKIMRLKIMEQTDLLKGGAREGRGLDKGRLMQKQFAAPPMKILNELWGNAY